MSEELPLDREDINAIGFTSENIMGCKVKDVRFGVAMWEADCGLVVDHKQGQTIGYSGRQGSRRSLNTHL